MLNTQILTEEFCANYIFCIDDINDGDEDSYWFDLTHIMNTQPHLDENKLITIIKKISRNLPIFFICFIYSKLNLLLLESV